MSIEAGTRLGPYEVQEFIGQGAMGIVFRAYHEQLERSGAVKVLQGIGVGPDAVARFHHEAQAVAQMRHPNIVNVFDFGEHEGTPYMIVEYVPGGNLASKMQQAPLDQATALRYLRGIAAGLDYAHSLGIVHRDVKPGNVLLETDGTPVLADFGLVKLLQGSSVQSMTGVTTGTPAYMAPEQVTGHQVGPAADRYSLATMAYEMLTGVIPFDGDGVLELLYAHVHREPPAPSTRNPSLGAAVDAVILRGLAKAPEARWETATAFVDALTSALAGDAHQLSAATLRMAPAAVPTRPVAAVSNRAATVAMAMPSAAPPPRAGTARKPRRRILELVGGAIIVILLLVVGGICAAANLQPAMSLDPTIAVPGDTVTVIAAHLPTNQPGQIQLHSDATYFFAFQADDKGSVSQGIVIPFELTTGMHQVRMCWGGSCPLHEQLRIVAPGSLPSPTPSTNPSPSGSGKPGTTPTPGRSPRPGSSPTPTSTSGSTAYPTSKPTPKPTPRPTSRPSPSPTPNPCPTPTAAAALNASPNTVLIGGGTVVITGTNFTPNKLVTLTYYKGGAYSYTKTVAVGCDGTFSTTVSTAGGVVRTDRVDALDKAGRSASATISIIL